MLNKKRSSKKERKSASVSSRRAQRRHSEDAANKGTSSTNGSKKAPSTSGNSGRRKNLTSASTPQLLNKAERTALERMHSATMSSTTVNGTLSTNAVANGHENSLEAELDCFNNRSMTKLSAENLDNKRLHESRISNKIFKPVGNATQNGSTLVNNNNNNSSVTHLSDELKHEQDDVDWDEVAIRNLIGEDSMNDIDRYFGKYFRKFVLILICFRVL